MNEVVFRTPPPKPDPLRNPACLVLELSTEQALPFAQLGECWAVIGKGSYPNHVGKLCLYAIPLPCDVATAASNVALGTHKAVRIKTATATPTAPKNDNREVTAGTPPGK